MIKEFKPEYVVVPGQTLQEHLDYLGMSQKELALRIDRTVKHVNEIIKGKAPITAETAIRLERVLSIPASFWLNLEKNYQELKAELEEKKRLKSEVGVLKRFPVKEMVKKGYLSAQDDELAQVQDLLRYLGVASFAAWERVIDEEVKGVFRTAKAYVSEKESLSIWLRQGRLQAQEMECRPFSRKIFREFVNEARKLTRKPLQEALVELKEMGSQAGVCLVIVPEIGKTRVSGATYWIKDRAVIQLSLRYRSNDQLWFSFFHEAGHIYLHGKRLFLDEAYEQQEDIEEQANRFAEDVLIPKDKWSAFLASIPGEIDVEDIARGSERLGIAEGILVGRLQYEGFLPYNSSFNRLKKFYKEEGLEKVVLEQFPPVTVG